VEIGETGIEIGNVNEAEIVDGIAGHLRESDGVMDLRRVGGAEEITEGGRAGMEEVGRTIVEVEAVVVALRC